jgi:hypothetical protein
MANITSENFFNANCDVDYSTAYILSYLVACLNDYCFNYIIVCDFFGKIFSLRNPQTK